MSNIKLFGIFYCLEDYLKIMIVPIPAMARKKAITVLVHKVGSMKDEGSVYLPFFKLLKDCDVA